MGIIKNYQSKGSCKVTFTFPVQAVDGITTVQVLGDFNNWDSNTAPKMKKTKDEFNTVIEITGGKTYEFRYLLDNGKWANDYAADAYVPSPYAGIDNSVLILDVITQDTKSVSQEKSSAIKKTNSDKPATKAAPKAEKVAVTKTSTTETQTTKKAVKSTPANDDLKIVEGIGPKIAELLNQNSIITFSDLSKAKVADLKKILDEAGPKFKMHDPSSWATQANLAAKGKWDELKKLQDELIAGKAKK